MIPRLPPESAVSVATARFLRTLAAGGFTGDVQIDEPSRLVGATDNSIYEIMPQAIVHPRVVDDLDRIVAALAAHPDVTLCARGGGTGTNGQSLHDGIIVETARHLTRRRDLVIDDDGAGGTITVEPGVVLDRLNAEVAAHGLMFAPMVSTSSRATIGGMISTDAAGKGSCLYGRTSDHVAELDLLLSDGTQWTSRALDAAARDAACAVGGRVGDIVGGVDALVTEHATEIASRFPPLVRFMTGYNLAGVRTPGQLDLNRLVAGAEGTLALIRQATLRLVRKPSASVIVAMAWPSFDDALGAASELAAYQPSAIETMDGLLVELAREDHAWRPVADLLRGDVSTIGALHLVEFTGDDRAAVHAQAQRLVDGAGALTVPPSALGVAREAETQAALWTVRKRAVGLLGNVPGAQRPMAFVEDCAVPPSALRSFIRGFRAILDDAGVRYGMFGHVDAGCLHVRPALDLTAPRDTALIRPITESVAALVAQHGGVLWGEHGKGFRGEFNPMFFGDTLYGVMREIKALFDPEHRLNPGKMATPARTTSALLTIDQALRGARDAAMAPETRDAFRDAVACNGNAACLNADPDAVMCPSSRATRDRVHSPKGRAAVMREWLRRLEGTGVTLTRADDAAGRRGHVVQRAWHSLGARLGRRDFSHDVKDAMEGCLACKACATMCPVRVDIPDLRSSFLDAYHTRYLRSPREHLIAGVEALLPRATRWAAVANALAPLGRLVGLHDAPRLVPGGLDRALRADGRDRWTGDARDLDPACDVVIVPDAFTSALEPHVVLAAVHAIEAAQRTVHVLPDRPSGKSHHVRGDLGGFRRAAARMIDVLTPLTERGVAVVGIDPAITLVYRDEYPRAFGARADGCAVQLLQEWFAAHAASDAPLPADAEVVAWYGHCTERTMVPASAAQWGRALAARGVRLVEVAVGCCGMCGAYGHDAAHVEESRAIFASSWAPRVTEETRRVVATGYSCREQMRRCLGRTVPHPVELLVPRA